MPVRHNKNGKLEYHRDDPIIRDIGSWDIFDVFGARPKKKRKIKPKIHKTLKEILETEHSCSPQECPACKNKECPNYKYEDLIEEGDFEV